MAPAKTRPDRLLSALFGTTFFMLRAFCKVGLEMQTAKEKLLTMVAHKHLLLGSTDPRISGKTDLIRLI